MEDTEENRALTKSTSHTRRKFIQSIVAASALTVIASHSNAQEKEDLSPLIEKYQQLRTDPLFNPKLYQDANYKTSAMDIVNNNLVDPYRITLATLRTMLNVPLSSLSKLSSEELDFISATCTAAETVKAIIHSGLRETANATLFWRLTYYLKIFILSWYKEKAEPFKNPSNLQDLIKGVDNVAKFYQESPSDAEKLIIPIISELRSLLNEGKLIPDAITDFILNLPEFSDPKGYLAIFQIAKVVVNRANTNLNRSKAGALLKMGADFEFDSLPVVAAYYAKPSALAQTDWAQIGSQIEKSYGYRGFIHACKGLEQRNIAWSEYLNNHGLDQPKPAYIDYDGMEVYGSEQALTDQQLQALFLSTSSDLFSAGKLPSTKEIADFKKATLPKQIRYIEYFFTKSTWDSIKNQLDKIGISPQEWMKLHCSELNEMLQDTVPKTDIRVAIKRLVILSDQTLLNRGHKFGNTSRGSNRNTYFFLTPEIDGYPQIDNISPWSLDVLARRVYETPFNLSSLPYKRQLPDGRLVPMDIGEAHESAHQLLDMADMYQYNSFDKPSSWQGKNTHDIPPKFKKFAFIKDGGVDLCMGNNAKPFYPWVETAHLLWMQTNEPDFFQTYYTPYKRYPEDRPDYDPFSAKPLELVIDNPANIQEAKIYPLKPDDSYSLYSQGIDNSLVFSARDIMSQLMHPERSALNVILVIHQKNGQKRYLPIPTFLLSAGYKLAELENLDKISFKLKFFQEPINNHLGNFKMLNIRFVPQEEYETVVKNLQPQLYATLATSFQGKDYFAVWSTV